MMRPALNLGLDELLAESDLSGLAFTLIERFSTQHPLEVVLCRLFDTVGNSLKSWSNSTWVTHVFTNPQLNIQECHILRCGDTPPNRYRSVRGQPTIPVHKPEGGLRLWKLKQLHFPEDVNDALALVTLPEEDRLRITGTVWVSQIDFANGLPLGHFCIAWRGDEMPVGEDNLAHLQSVIWHIGKCVARMLLNHHAIHATTYLPSYWQEGPKRSAILFADIRNSTPLFEVARLGGEKHIRRVESLLQAWLSYAAQLITVSGIGQIQRFAGDGFMATFGEYLIPADGQSKDQPACTLALHSAKYLIDSFDKLYSAWRQFPAVSEFYSDHNEDVDLSLGVGINYGNIYFGYYGVACSPFDSSCPAGFAGHLEFTAIGDHVNTTQRFESIASKPTKEIDLYYRGQRFSEDFRSSPIIVSQTVAAHLPKILSEDWVKTQQRRGVAHLKGKGARLPFFEVQGNDLQPHVYRQCLRGFASDHYFNQLINPPALDPLIETMKNRMHAIDRAPAS